MAGIPPDRLPLAYHGRCDKHEETAAFFRCNGTRNDGTPCPLRPRSEWNYSYLPTCGHHKNQMIEAARCEAIESCGKACYRLAAADPPFNLCLKHCGGTNTLRCYLMEMPVEIRMMIFEHVFPATIPARRYHESISWRSYGLNLSILKLNRQICKEAVDVLYGKSEFGVVITHDEITMMGRTWKRPGVGGSIPCWTQVHPPRTVQRIKKVKLQVFLGHGTSLPAHRLGEPTSWMNQIAGIDFSLFQSRDLVRKLVWVLQSSKLIHLSVEPHLEAPSTWKTDEVTCAIRLALEPLREITVLESRVLGLLKVTSPPSNRNPDEITRYYGEIFPVRPNVEDEEYRAYQRTFSTPLPIQLWLCRLPLRRSFMVALQLYSQLELFSSAVFIQNAAQHTPGQSLASQTFLGLERVMHLARLAREGCDLVMLENIKSAVLQKWGQNVHTAYSQGRQVDKAVRSLLRNPPVVPPDMVLPQYVDRRWDILWMGTPPDFSGSMVHQHRAVEEEVEVSEDEARVYHYFPRLNIRLSALKTPAMVRAARARARRLQNGNSAF